MLPPLAALLYLALAVLTWVEAIRYIWSSDAAFDAKVKTYQAGQPGPFGFFWGTEQRCTTLFLPCRTRAWALPPSPSAP